MTSVLPASTGAGPIVLEAVAVAWELDLAADDAAAVELAAALDEAAACASDSALALELAAASEEALALDSDTALALDSDEALALEDDLAFAREIDADLSCELVESFEEALLPHAASNSADVAMIVTIVNFFKLYSFEYQRLRLVVVNCCYVMCSLEGVQGTLS